MHLERLTGRKWRDDFSQIYQHDVPLAIKQLNRKSFFLIPKNNSIKLRKKQKKYL